MDGSFARLILKATFLYSGVLCLLSTAVPTILIELPIIYFGKVTKNIKFIIVLNVFTNSLFNAVLAILFLINNFNCFWPMIVWYALAELILIPISEANLYKKISDTFFKRILLFSYLANMASCLAGIGISYGIMAIFAAFY